MSQGQSIDIRVIKPKLEPEVASGVTRPTEPSVLHDPLVDRYGPLRSISWWDQELLRRSSAMVVGAGALGNEVLKNLALMGIGRIAVVDFDRVETGNLSCAPLYRAADAGRLKVEVAAEALRDLNPEVEVLPLACDVCTEIGLGLVRRMDIVVGCLDSREARLAVNRHCYLLGKPWVDGAIQELLGVARVFWPGRGACYECTLTDADWETIRHHYSCTLLAVEGLARGKVATTPILAAIIGGLQAQEAMKILHGLQVESGRGLIFNGLSNHVYTITYPSRPDCSVMDCRMAVIEELPGARSNSLTVGELLALGQERLGEGSIIELNFELVVELHCPSCGQGEPVYRPLRTLNARHASCPRCGQTRRARSIHALDTEGEYLDRCLCEVGIPPFHIVSLRRGETYHHFELTGDRERCLP